MRIVNVRWLSSRYSELEEVVYEAQIEFRCGAGADRGWGVAPGGAVDAVVVASFHLAVDYHRRGGVPVAAWVAAR